MWLFLLFLAVSDASARLCLTPVDIICKPLEEGPDYIPGSETGLLRRCPLVSDYIDCLNSYDLACAGRSTYAGLEPPLYYSRIRAFLDNACDENSPMHKVLARSLPCMKSRSAASDPICREDRKKMMKEYEEYLTRNSFANKKARGIQSRKERKDCLHDTFTAACVLKDIEVECGYLAYEVGLGALKKTQVLAARCGLDAFQDLSDAIPKLKMKPVLKELLKNIFAVELQ